MNTHNELRRLGVPDSIIATATVNGKPLAEIVSKSPGKRPPLKHDLTDAFFELWKRLGPDRPAKRDFRFHQTRRWKFDAAWPAEKVAVELEGGIWTRGRHTRGKGYWRDMQKYNAAVWAGWRLFRFAANDLEFDPLGVVEQVKSALEKQ